MNNEQGLPVVMCGDHERAGQYVSRLLFIAARRWWRENQTLFHQLGKHNNFINQSNTGVDIMPTSR